MARITGQTLYLNFDGVDIKALYRSFDPGIELENVDVSAGGNAARQYAGTLMKISPKLTVIMDTDEMGTAVTKILNVLKLGNEGSLIWGPAGTATGMDKWGMTAKVFKANPPKEYDGETEVEVEFENTGTALLFDGSTAVW